MYKYFFVLATSFLILFNISPAQAENLPDFKDLARESGPAVVNISTEKTVERVQNIPPFLRNMPKGTPFDDFFEQFGMPPMDNFGPNSGMPQTRKEKSLGSGFIISPDGYLVTNNHVVENATEITVNLQGKSNKLSSTKAVIVGADAETDLALLKIETDSPLPYLEFGDSNKLEVGEWVIAIGNPFGLDHSVTKGIISAKGRNIQAGPFDSFLQTDASINPGNSGGPLIDMQGKVIGINTAIIASGQGIGFAIPSDMARDIIEQLKQHKTVKRGWLGVQIQAVDDATAAAMGLNEARGALVSEVFANEPAEKAGIKPGDIIIKVDGQDITDNTDLLHKVAKLSPDKTVPIIVWREGKEKELQLTLGTRDSNRTAANDNKPGASNNSGSASLAELGISVRPLTKEEAKAIDNKEEIGLLITSLEADKPASQAGLQQGDLLLSANLKELKNNDDLNQVIKNDADKKGAVMFKVMRRGQTFFVAVPLKK